MLSTGSIHWMVSLIDSHHFRGQRWIRLVPSFWIRLTQHLPYPWVAHTQNRVMSWPRFSLFFFINKFYSFAAICRHPKWNRSSSEAALTVPCIQSKGCTGRPQSLVRSYNAPCGGCRRISSVGRTFHKRTQEHISDSLSDPDDRWDRPRSPCRAHIHLELQCQNYNELLLLRVILRHRFPSHRMHLQASGSSKI